MPEDTFPTEYDAIAADTTFRSFLRVALLKTANAVAKTPPPAQPSTVRPFVAPNQAPTDEEAAAMLAWNSYDGERMDRAYYRDMLLAVDGRVAALALAAASDDDVYAAWTGNKAGLMAALRAFCKAASALTLTR